MEITSFHPVNTFINTDKIEGKDTIRVTKDPKVKAVDEATYARLVESDFQNGIIEVKVLSRLLEDAPDFARGFIGIAFRIDESNSKFGLWVDVGTEGHFTDLRIEDFGILPIPAAGEAER